MDGNHDTSDEAYLSGGNAYVVEDTDEAIVSGDGDDEKSNSPLREQDRFLPIANVARIMKKAIPASGKSAKGEKTAAGVGGDGLGEIGEDVIGHSLSGSAILTDQTGQQNVIYTSFAPGQARDH
ncbi:hypothetical protein C0Q70_14720 [Pomacea canaliculata]|uniref:Uncharacterized protein n=1 Tax=Pomacea canaliculata TaxID=400727 RepID=A0A2T7NST9_POMCA|nr:hypothetical protein C0Q70_14720 [Pomacea canaliculata]